MPRPTVMVTGAAGFIGSRVVRRLLIEGFPTLAVVRSADPGRLSRLRSVLNRRGGLPLQTVACDLHDLSAVAALIAVHRPVACIHAAWDVDPDSYREDIRNDRWVASSLHLLRELRSHGCQWMGVFGTCIEPHGDGIASCRYAAAKAMLRIQMMRTRGKASTDERTRICWWKVFQPYGPGEAATRLVPSMIDSLLGGRPYEVNRPHDVRDFIHVDDIAAAAVASMVHRTSGVYELGTGIGTSLGDMAGMAAGLLDADPLLRLHGLHAGERSHGVSLLADSRGLMVSAQWKPATDLRSGLAHLIAHACRKALAA